MTQKVAPPSPNAVLQHGTIIAAFGRHYDVVPATHDSTSIIKCYPRGKKSPYACGDRVNFEISGPNQGIITALLPRSNLLWRSDAFREKLIAANLSQIAIVVATEPGFSDMLISRCIAAAEHQRLKTCILLNKCDLSDRLPAAYALLEPFIKLGYRCIELSALHNTGSLAEILAGEQSIFVGQSGMGKSTLTNALIPQAKAATREISTALNSGKHTTTFARLYPLDTHGWLIDSPGLQAFGLAHLEPAELEAGFIEFRPYLGQCRFRDCQHEAEPGCALRAAIDAGDITARRFEHFVQIRNEIRHAKQQSRGW